MSDIHIVLQGKGGVGKTVISHLLLEWYRLQPQQHGHVLAYDIDPVNFSLAEIDGHDATRIRLMNNGAIVTRQFGTLVKHLFSSTNDTIIIDSGATTFIPFAKYLAVHQTCEKLMAANHKVVMHVPVAAGGSYVPSVNGLLSVLKAFGHSVPVVVWLNEVSAKVVNPRTDETFREGRAYKNNSHLIAAVIELDFLSGMERTTLFTMFGKRVSFDIYRSMTKVGMLDRERVEQVIKRWFAAISTARETWRAWSTPENDPRNGAMA